MLDLIERPDLVHAAVERMVDAWMVELDQFVALNALALDCNNTRIGSGGYGYTRELPGADFDPDYVQPHNMWGCSNAQVFSEVSPEMHWEFAMRHDLRWLARWGLTYYGCCEPLHQKIDLLRQIPNLRKLSVSPRCDSQRVVQEVGTDYVISRKPNPAILAEDDWQPAAGAAGTGRIPGRCPRLPRRADHEGRLDGPLPAATALGVGRDRHGGGRGVCHGLT